MSDSRDLFRFLRVKIQNLVQRGVVTLSGTRYQGTHMGGRVADELESFEPQGLHFRAPVGAEYVQLHPGAEPANALMICAHDRGGLPADELEQGEGGLHLLGTYKVFLDSDGKLYLGGTPIAPPVDPLHPEVQDYLVQVDKFKALISTMLTQGLSAGGPGAANFAAARLWWEMPDPAANVTNITAGTTKTKAT